MDHTSEKLRRYLLGLLPASEAEEIDLQIITDDSLSDALAHAEHELIEDHLDQSLTPEEDELFRKNFLISEERRQMISETKLLRAYADRVSEPIAMVSEPAVGVFEKLRAIFVRPLFAGAAVIAALLIALLVWQVFIRDTSTQLEREYAAINSRDLTNISEFSPSATVSLVGSTLRDGGGPPRRTLAELSEPALFRVALAQGEKTDRGFSVQVLKGSSPIFRVNGLKAYSNNAGTEIRVLLPRSIFTSGQFQIRIENKSSGTSTNYPLVID